MHSLVQLFQIFTSAKQEKSAVQWGPCFFCRSSGIFYSDLRLPGMLSLFWKQCKLACCREKSAWWWEYQIVFSVLIIYSSQNHSTAEAVRELWRPPAPSPAPAGPPSAGCPGPRPGTLCHSPRRRPHSLSGQPGPVLSHPPSTQVLPGAQREPPACPLVPTAPGLALGTPDKSLAAASLPPACGDSQPWVRSP